jgi:signal peptidase I
MQILSSGFPVLWQRFRFATLTLVLFLLIRAFALEAFTIPTSSMENTLLVGDFLLVNKALYGAEIPGTRVRLPAFRDPQRGEVVVFRPPHDPARNYVKRIVALPGDTVAMREKILHVNGVAQEEEYAIHRQARGDAFHPGMAWQSGFLAAARPRRRYVPSRDNWGSLVVPPGKYFVLGDNRDNSEDSRYWGFVGREEIHGHPWLIYLSVEKGEDSLVGWLGKVRWRRLGHRVQ